MGAEFGCGHAWPEAERWPIADKADTPPTAGERALLLSIVADLTRVRGSAGRRGFATRRTIRSPAAAVIGVSWLTAIFAW